MYERTDYQGTLSPSPRGLLPPPPPDDKINARGECRQSLHLFSYIINPPGGPNLTPCSPTMISPLCSLALSTQAFYSSLKLFSRRPLLSEPRKRAGKPARRAACAGRPRHRPLCAANRSKQVPSSPPPRRPAAAARCDPAARRGAITKFGTYVQLRATVARRSFCPKTHTLALPCFAVCTA